VGSASAATSAPRHPVHELERLAGCSTRADALAGVTPSRELVTVIAPTTTSQRATLELFEREDGCFRLVLGPYDAWVGHNGLSAHKHEGDGTTPIGRFSFGATMYGTLADPGVTYQYHRLVCGDWWDEQSGTTAYNHFVHVACGTKLPFGGDSEALWTEAPAYDYFAVISYNTSPVVANLGSAIFLHVSLDGPTEGCVSIPESNLVRVLRALRPSLDPLIDISTHA
jgi:L,D-peptidoglycan transpeptidase YkuD (ErfK/YbiS/YcfS/YnhG family)